MIAVIGIVAAAVVLAWAIVLWMRCWQAERELPADQGLLPGERIFVGTLEVVALLALVLILAVAERA